MQLSAQFRATRIGTAANALCKEGEAQCLARLMNPPADTSKEESRKKVGVYDRPASADRFRNLRVWVLVFAVAASAASAYFFFGS